jgi:inward rectifier potassium channel
MTMSAPPLVGAREEPQDLGLGRRISDQGLRMLHRDGTFNVERRGLPFLRRFSTYHAMVRISWPRFYAIIVSAYLATNVLFAAAYLACGPEALEGTARPHLGSRAIDCFFFSVQTIATIGYGRISPVGLAANVLVAVEAFVGLLGFAMATALAFARFSQPQAKVLYSRKAVIAPYRGGSALEFRVINERDGQLIEVEAKVLFSRMEIHEGRRVRRFYTLPLERSKVTFFPIQWVVVHPIDDASPLLGTTSESLAASQAEFLILLSGIDEAFAQAVHSRSSYRFDEIVVGGRFVDMYEPSEDGVVRVDVSRFHEVEPAPLP